MRGVDERSLELLSYFGLEKWVRQDDTLTAADPSQQDACAQRWDAHCAPKTVIQSF